jgi:TRAP transporter TAXI family solute receptor
MSRGFFARAMLALFWVGAAGCGADRTGNERRFLSIGTAGTGGLYYPIGGAFASRLSARDSGRTWTAEVTGGSVENIQRLMNGDIDLGFAIGTTVFEAYNGGQDFATSQTRLRVIAPLYANVTHVLVRENAGIASVADFRGRRVSVGAAGSGTEQVAVQLLEAYGLTYDAIDERYLSFTESAAALGDGAIDAAILSVGYPASAVLEAMTTGRVRLLALDSGHVRLLTDRHAYYSAASIPAGAYPDQDRALPTFSVLNWIVARDDLPGAIVDHVLDTLFEDLDALRRAVDIAGQIRLTNMYAAPIPLHSAARAWLERHLEAGRDSAGPAPPPGPR